MKTPKPEKTAPKKPVERQVKKPVEVVVDARPAEIAPERHPVRYWM